MKTSFYTTLAAIVLSLGLLGCATRLSSLDLDGASISVGDKFEVPVYSVRFINRGYIDSIKPAHKKIDRLRDGIDYDGYHEKPKAEIPAGTEVTIHKIYKTQTGRVFVTALLNDEKVDITRFIRPTDTGL